MTIGEVAERSGLPVKTIRYYEEIGLISPSRSVNRYRAFGEREVHILAFLARARSLGFSINDCRALISLWQDRHRASADVKALAAEHLAAISRKIAELESMRDTLSALVSRCQGNDRPDCPILDDLSFGRDN
ncbi:MAG: Cu(I)-responsive transcriptional regulator [Pseudomonadota bacterium]